MQFYNPVHIIAGAQALEELGSYCKSLYTGKGVLLLTRGLDFWDSPACQALRNVLKPYKVQEAAISVSNPDVADMADMLASLKGKTYDAIIGVGGGTVMDTAKTLALAIPAGISGTEGLRKFVADGQYDGIVPIPWVGIPTTSGTGSEATPWATVWDRQRECKMSCSCSRNFAVAAVIDAQFTATCPLSLTVSSALDAVCHATESFWSRHTNEITQAFSLLAIRKIRTLLQPLTQHLDDVQLRQDIGNASLYAGIAFSNTRTTVCHSVSYPLTEKFGIPHGTAAALSLGDFMAFNQKAIPRYDELLAAFDCQSAEEVKQWIFSLLQIGGFSVRLRDYGITEQDIPYLVDHAFTKGRADNNPVPVQASDVEQVLHTLL